MKRFAVLAAVAAVLAAGPVFADTMDNAHSNTIVVTYANGASSRYHFNADNTFALQTPDGQHVTGTYEVTGDQICLTPAGGQRACAPLAAGKNVGDTWTQTATDGSQITVALEAGR